MPSTLNSLNIKTRLGSEKNLSSCPAVALKCPYMYTCSASGPTHREILMGIFLSNFLKFGHPQQPFIYNNHGIDGTTAKTLKASKKLQWTKQKWFPSSASKPHWFKPVQLQAITVCLLRRDLIKCYVHIIATDMKKVYTCRQSKQTWQPHEARNPEANFA